MMLLKKAALNYENKKTKTNNIPADGACDVPDRGEHG